MPELSSGIFSVQGGMDMSQKQYLEVAKIINTHGVRGEVKAESWADSPEVVASLKELLLDDRPVKVLSGRVHGAFALLKLEGVDTVEAAMALKGKVLFADRRYIPIEEGAFFLQDAIGMPVRNEDGTELGTLADVMDYPSGRIFVVRGKEEHLIPENGGFIRDFDLETRTLTVRLIEGM